MAASMLQRDVPRKGSMSVPTGLQEGRARPVLGRRDDRARPGHLHPPSRPRSRNSTTWEGLNFDLIITLSPEAHHKALELTRTLAADVEYWPTHDPTGTEGNREQKLQAYREVCDGLSLRIRPPLFKSGRHTASEANVAMPLSCKR